MMFFCVCVVCMCACICVCAYVCSQLDLLIKMMNISQSAVRKKNHFFLFFLSVLVLGEFNLI